ncbi:phage tail tape measure protein [Aeromonas piscicola]|uniref:phage tail tape measure protein n=1 Tax=Aeromonas piscicola TaxID=600645 RepID=UPI0021F8301A|nr:phage tail tape measure protein [Aeromonas piscicola]MCW0506918.1 phage tail tape measure protein [Aeromonas piscicola]
MAWMEKLMMQVALVDNATKPLAGINTQIDQISKAGRQGWANMAMGTTTVVAGAMAIQNVLGPAIEMDRALAEVASLDVHEKTLKQLSDTALRFSVDYGASASEFVRASYDIQSAIAGLEGNELPAFARASGVLAKATKADTATITNYMGTMYGIFEQQAKRMGKATWVEDVAGKTATAVQMFKTTGQGMTDAFKGIGANATAAGISMDEQFAVLGHLQATMGGGEAGTKFKSFLSGIGSAQKALGLQFTDSAGNMLPVLDVLDKLKARYGETLTIAGSDELKKAFGSDEAVSMIKLLMSNTKALSSSINALGNTHGMGKAEQMAAAMTDQWQRVESAWFAIRAAAFGAVLPAINQVVGAFADGADTVLRWARLFPHLTKAVSYATLAIVGLGMVTGVWLLLAGLAKLVTLGWGIVMMGLLAPLKLLRGAMALMRTTVLLVNLAMYANPVLLIVGGILALVAAVALAIVYWDELYAAFSVLTSFELLGAFFSGLAETFGPLASQALVPIADTLGIIVTLLGQAWDWLGSFFGATEQASLGVDGVTDAGRRLGTVLGAVFEALLTPWQWIIKAIRYALDLMGMIPGIDIDTSKLVMPDLSLPMSAQLLAQPQTERINAPLARYRQQGQSTVPAGGLGQQLIQANAAASSTNQKPTKALHIGEVHMHNQNPMTPEQMAENAWLETK